MLYLAVKLRKIFLIYWRGVYIIPPQLVRHVFANVAYPLIAHTSFAFYCGNCAFCQSGSFCSLGHELFTLSFQFFQSFQPGQWVFRNPILRIWGNFRLKFKGCHLEPCRFESLAWAYVLLQRSWGRRTVSRKVDIFHGGRHTLEEALSILNFLLFLCFQMQTALLFKGLHRIS